MPSLVHVIKGNPTNRELEALTIVVQTLAAELRMSSQQSAGDNWVRREYGDFGNQQVFSPGAFVNAPRF